MSKILEWMTVMMSVHWIYVAIACLSVVVALTVRWFRLERGRRSAVLRLEDRYPLRKSAQFDVPDEYEKLFEEVRRDLERRTEEEEEEEGAETRERGMVLYALSGDESPFDQAARVLAKASSPSELLGGAGRDAVTSLTKSRLTKSRPDPVACSLFAPPQVRAYSPFLIQVFLHAPEHLMWAVRAAIKVDKHANKRGGALLRTLVCRGEIVQLFLDCPGLSIADSAQEIKWHGEPTNVIFEVEALPQAAPEPIDGVLHVAIGNIPVGEIAFTLFIEQQETSFARPIAFVDTRHAQADHDLQMPLATATRYEKAFISYSRKDFGIVSFFAQGLGEKGIRPCVDIDDLEPGDDWRAKLRGNIDRADVFYLMWSDNAAESDHVLEEAHQAASRHKTSQFLPRRPRIKPIPLQQPWPEPPDFLREFHFYSAWQAHRTAQSAGLVNRTN